MRSCDQARLQVQSCIIRSVVTTFNKVGSSASPTQPENADLRLDDVRSLSTSKRSPVLVARDCTTKVKWTKPSYLFNIFEKVLRRDAGPFSAMGEHKA